MKVLCLADEKFRKSYPKWESLIKEIIDYVDSHIKEVSFSIKTMPWNTKSFKNTHKDYFKDLEKEKNKYDLVIGFSDKYKSSFQDNLDFRGMCDENLIMTTKYFPVRIPFLYKLGLKKLTLHEVGHVFGMRDSKYTQFSIMDYFWGLFTSRFTKKQKRKIKRFLKEGSGVRDKLFSE